MGRFVSGEFVLGRAIDIAVLSCMIIVRRSLLHQYLAEKGLCWWWYRDSRVAHNSNHWELT